MKILRDDYPILSGVLGGILDEATLKAGQPKFEFQDFDFQWKKTMRLSAM